MIVKPFIWKPGPFIYRVWILFSIGIVPAQTKISSLEFFGNSFFSQRQILDQLPAVSGSFVSSFEQSKIVLKEIYRSEGFYNFSIDSVLIRYSDDSTTAHLQLFLNEHTRVVIAEIKISGNRSFSSNVIEPLLETSEGTPLNSAILESDMQSLLNFYSRQGFPFASISSDSFHTDALDPSKLVVHFVIDEGKKVYLDEVRVEGNSTTSTNVVIREARIQRGELFNQEKIENIRRRLERLQLFSSVSEPQLYVISPSNGDSLRGGLRISVKEGNTNSFDGIVGYIPSTSPATEGYFTGNIFAALRNLFGTGRKAVIKWQRETASTQELELQYREPWLFGLPLNVNGLFFQRKQDSLYVKTKLELRGEYSISEELTIAGNVSSESVYPSSTVIQFSVFESNAIFFGAEVMYDTRDNIRNPSSGIKYSTTVQQGTKKITGPQQYLNLAAQKDFSIQKYGIDAEMFISPYQRHVIMAGVHGKQVSSSQLELSDLFQFGGTTTLRGYRENQFFASQIAYINLEYRFLTGRASSLFGFVDLGYSSRPADPIKGIAGQENKDLYGYGIGAHIETGLGILNINYALGKGDSFSNGKIHIGIINEF